MINLFKPERSYLDKLKDRSESALSMFRKTLADLSLVNFDAQEEIDTNTEEIKTLLDENQVLSKIKEDNSKIITKIEEFLG